MVTPNSDLCRHKVVALYKFVSVPEVEIDSLQSEVEKVLRASKARGTILLATEGINGTICYPEQQDKDEVLDFLNNHHHFHGLRTRISYVENAIFHRLKVKKKKEIVTIGRAGGGDSDGDGVEKPVGFMQKCTIDPTKIVGKYVKPGKEWDDLLDDPDVVVIDTRNKYEIDIGTFENAVSPNTDNFRQFPDWLHRFAKACEEADKKKSNVLASQEGQCVLNTQKVDNKKEGIFSNARTLEPVKEEDMPTVKRKPKAVAMFCTGGIRCEKSTSYTIAAEVFPSGIPVYHLDGGVLAYLDAHPDETKSKWHGECFVFDQRVAVTHGLKPSSTYNACHACRRPISVEDMKRPDYVKGLSCRYCIDQATEKQQKRFKERQKQVELAKVADTNPHIHDSRYKNNN